jgi:hypothetical protein
VGSRPSPFGYAFGNHSAQNTDNRGSYETEIQGQRRHEHGGYARQEGCVSLKLIIRTDSTTTVTEVPAAISWVAANCAAPEKKNR